MVDIVSIVIAVISLFGTIITSGITAWTSFYSEDRKRLTQAEALLAKYRDPLLLAADDLQSKLGNIVDRKLTRWIQFPGDQKDYLVLHTCFVIGQYFSWIYILRREAQFLRFSTDQQNKNFTKLLSLIRYAFRTESEGNVPFMIWTGEQQALGESMTVEDNGQHVCMGYGTFCSKWKDEEFRRWFNRLISDITLLAQIDVSGERPVPDQRLRRLQHLLVDLVGELDPKGLRYEAAFVRRCIPAPGCACSICHTNAPNIPVDGKMDK